MLGVFVIGGLVVASLVLGVREGSRRHAQAMRQARARGFGRVFG